MAVLLSAPGMAFAQGLVVDTGTDVLDGDTTSIAALLANKGPDGFISLREAIIAANRTPNGGTPDSIKFNIGGGGIQTIVPLTVLPTVTDTIVIDGFTQPGASPGTLPFPSPLDAVLMIEITGTALAGAGAPGLMVSAGGSTIRGLVINSFTGGGAHGIYVLTNGGNTLEGNFIGTDASGAVAMGVQGYAVYLGSPSNLLGGTGAGAGNLISGNLGYGVRISGNGNRLQGNFVGPDATGSMDLGNGASGIGVFTGSNILIGGAASGAGNLISGNTNGIWFNSSPNLVTVQGNRIGTDITGRARIANAGSGILVNSPNARIGGTAPGAGNLISGNINGVTIAGSANNTVVQGNLIGTDVDGTGDLGNTGVGISINTTISSSHTIGGTVSGASNTIAYSGGDNVALLNSAHTASILGNSIFGSDTPVGDLGIDLGADGVTANDPGDGDPGANELLNFPVLTSTTESGGMLTVGFNLDVNPGGWYRIEFFKNPSGSDPSGNGEGEVFADSTRVSHTGAGVESFSHSLTGAVGDIITATATRCTDGPACAAFGPTSEFSAPDTAAAPRFVVDTDTDVLDGDTTSIAALLANKGADGFISLREAIIAANRTPNGAAPDSIKFDIGGGGVQTIVPLTALPIVTQAVVVDGSTQPGAVCPAPVIELNGGKLFGSESGLVVASDDVTIRGLAIHTFPRYGIYLQKGTNSTVACTYVGLDAGGVANRGNGLQGIRIDNGPQLIGGTDPADRNVISGNSSGVYLQGTSAADVVIQGNYIGTNAAGDGTIPNSIEGVRITGGLRTRVIDNVISGNSTGISVGGDEAVVQGNLIGTDPTGMVDLGNVDGINVGTGLRAMIGGTSAAERNVISGSGDAGIQIGGDSATIVGNYIGVAADGSTPMGNFRGMVLLNGSEGNVIGGTGPNEGNIIAHSLADGVNLYGTTTIANPIRGNSIFLNGGLGIDLDPNGVTPNDLGDVDAGPHNLTNFPFFEKAELNPTAGTLELTGWTRPTSTVDLYIANTDATEFGEGETWLTALTEGDVSDLDASVTAYTHPQAGSDSTSRFRFVISTPPGVTAGTRLTATAHYAKYGTSEFSLVVKVVETPVQIVSSATDQTFWVGKAPTATSTITVAEGTSPSISAANDIRIRIPSGFDMTWDTLDVAATIGGSAAARVSPTVNYEDAGKTLVLDVTSDFFAVDTVTIADLGFLDFASASGPDNLELEVDDAGTVAAEDDKAIEILPGGTPTISSELDQSFRVGDPPNSISTTTVRADAAAPTITAANDIRIRIPFGFNMTWDTSDVTALILGTAAAKVSNTVSYEDGGRTLVIDVLTDFDPGDLITIEDLSFVNFTAASLDDNLELEVRNDGQVSATDDKVIFIVLILVTPDIHSSRDQYFTVGDPSTPMVAIRITDDDVIPQVTAANDIRITIPADLDMVWDVSQVTAQIGARASQKVSPTVSYEDGGKTLVLDVITDFVARDWISVRGLSFASFTSAGAASRLQLRVYNDASVVSIDSYIKQILGGVFSVDVWPDTVRDSRLPSNGSNYTVDFTVSNIGSTTDDYDLLTSEAPGTALTVVSIAGPGVTQGANPDSARLASLPAGESAVVTVTYAAGLAPVGTIDTLSFVARSVTSPAQSDDGLLVFTVIRPNITMSKVVNPSGTQAPGTDLTYTAALTNAGTEAAVGVSSVSSIASETQFKVGSVATSFPAGIVVAVDYSSDGGSGWAYTPVSGGCSAPAGYDGCLTDIRWTLQNPLLSGAPDNAGTMEYVARIK